MSVGVLRFCDPGLFCLDPTMLDVVSNLHWRRKILCVRIKSEFHLVCVHLNWTVCSPRCTCKTFH